MSTLVWNENKYRERLIEDPGVTKTIARVANLIMRGSRWARGYCHYTKMWMAEALGIALRSVKMALKYLIDSGYVVAWRARGRRNLNYRPVFDGTGAGALGTDAGARGECDAGDQGDSEQAPGRREEGGKSTVRMGGKKLPPTVDVDGPTSLRSVVPSPEKSTVRIEARSAGGGGAALPPLAQSPAVVSARTRTCPYMPTGEPATWEEWERMTLGLAGDSRPAVVPPWLGVARSRRFDPDRVAAIVAKLVLYLKRGNRLRWVGRRYADGKLREWLSRERFTSSADAAGYRRIPGMYDGTPDEQDDYASGAMFDSSYS